MEPERGWSGEVDLLPCRVELKGEAEGGGSVGDGGEKKSQREGGDTYARGLGEKEKRQERNESDVMASEAMVLYGPVPSSGNLNQPTIPASQAKVTVQQTRGSTVETRGRPSAACSIPYGVQCLAGLILLYTWAFLDAAGVGPPDANLHAGHFAPARSSRLACANLSSEACPASHSLFHRERSQVCGLSLPWIATSRIRSAKDLRIQPPASSRPESGTRTAVPLGRKSSLGAEHTVPPP